MRGFIRRHWRAYLIGAVVAVAAGAIAAYIVGIKASTPADVRRQRVVAEQRQGALNDGYEDSHGPRVPGNGSAA